MSGVQYRLHIRGNYSFICLQYVLYNGQGLGGLRAYPTEMQEDILNGNVKQHTCDVHCNVTHKFLNKMFVDYSMVQCCNLKGKESAQVCSSTRLVRVTKTFFTDTGKEFQLTVT